MSRSWQSRVQLYLDELEQIVRTIDSTLEQTQVETSRVDADRVDQSIGRLQQALAGLEEKIAQREALLRASDAPEEGSTLTAKLQAALNVDDARLARRCEQLAHQMADAHGRAISLFICQYHLANFSTEIAQLLTGSALPSTYAAPGSCSAPSHPNTDGGGLLNESA